MHSQMDGTNTSTNAEHPLDVIVDSSGLNGTLIGPELIQVLDIRINGEFPNLSTLVHTSPDDPAAPYISMRSPILDVASPRTIALAKKCIDECAHGHERCGSLSVTLDPVLPTRLIDCTDPAAPQLHSTGGNQCGKYLALSYVWGEPQPYSTTKSNICAYEREIDLSILPATIRDAVYITHALGFQFLWADTLCIVQDDDEDRRRELANMHRIYRFAHITIIAASAEKVSDGFLQDRSPVPQLDLTAFHPGPRGMGDITLPFLCPPDSATPAPLDRTVTPQLQLGSIHLTPDNHSILAPSPDGKHYLYDDQLGLLGTRGWCMQEFLLTPRSLIFTSRTIQFRCQTSTQSIGGAFCNDEYRWLLLPRALFLPNPPPLPHDSAEWREAHETWRWIVHDYTGRKISFPSDKLLACAAIAEQFHEVLQSDYVVGMWRASLFPSLRWYTLSGEEVYRPTAYRAPSWSWASIDGQVHPPNVGYRWDIHVGSDREADALAEIIRCEVTLEDAALPFGRVTSGILVLRASLLRCQILRAEWRDGLDSRKILSRGILLQLDDEGEVDVDSKPIRGEATIDCKAGADETGRMGTVWAVPLQAGMHMRWGPEDEAIPGIQGIIIALAGSNDLDLGVGSEKASYYRRVGFFSLPSMLWDKSHVGGESAEAVRKLWRDLMDGKYPREDIALV